VYGEIIAAWARWAPGRLMPLGWDAADCRGVWESGVPLLPRAPAPIVADDLEELLAFVMERLAVIKQDAVPWLQRVAEAWDQGAIAPAALFPTPGGVGARIAETIGGATTEMAAFLAYGSLRPALEAYFAQARSNLGPHDWAFGVCPFCGAPAAFSDVLEDGRRRLACHLCGGGWFFPRTKCPTCASERSEDLLRLEPESQDQGYVIIACSGCGGYLKELDRRVRWNGQSALVEDWGSPHLDLIAHRAGYRRPAPVLIGLAQPI
jgi:hypothetical protein